MKHRLIGASCFAIILAGCSHTPPQTNETTSATAELVTFTSERIYYSVPNNVTEEIVITAKIDTQTDTITDIQAEHVAHHHKSQRYMQWFDDGIAAAVVGEKIDEAQVKVINGASDTSHGFNEAILNIQAQYEQS